MAHPAELARSWSGPDGPAGGVEAGVEAGIKEAKRLHRKDRAFQQRFGSRPAIVTYSR